MDLMPPDLPPDLTAFVAARPPRAAAFIVTLYGDAVGPRGGALGMAAIIETCARVGISETLVRTAVSRLVAAGQLQGDRRGRRSFYRLTPEAAQDFAAASRVIYGPAEAAGWRLVAGPEAALAGLERAGFARLRPGLALGPDRGPVPDGVAVVAGPSAGDRAALRDLAVQLWDLRALSEALLAVRMRFAPWLPVAQALPGPEALALRLLLVHDYRLAVLADPRLPPEALPADWPAAGVRALFARLYLALTPAAEDWIAEAHEAGFGPLPARTKASLAQLDALNMSQTDSFFGLICDV
jgi:phenylacetic acid degradation operon negative regulatory protein